MMASTGALTIEMRPRWWVGAYLNTLILLCRSLGTQPDADKVIGFLLRYGYIFTIGGRRV